MPSQYVGQVGFPCAVAAFDGILLLTDGNGVNAEKPDGMSVMLLLYMEESLIGVLTYGDLHAALAYSASSLWSAVCSLRAALRILFLSDRWSKTPESLDLPTVGFASSDQASCRIFVFCARRAYCLVLRHSIRVALEI